MFTVVLCEEETKLKLEVVPFSVLGASKDVHVSPDEVVVDPAGLNFVQGTLKGASGASGAIYDWLKLKNFPPDVKEGIQAEGQAKFHSYAPDKHVIHVVGPNFTVGRTTYEEAVERLSVAYTSVFREMAQTPYSVLRLLPISGSIFAGPFKAQIFRLTYEACTRGFNRLSSTEKMFLRSRVHIKLCVMSSTEYPKFQRAFGIKTSQASGSVSGARKRRRSKK